MSPLNARLSSSGHTSQGWWGDQWCSCLWPSPSLTKGSAARIFPLSLLWKTWESLHLDSKSIALLWKQSTGVMGTSPWKDWPDQEWSIMGRPWLWQQTVLVAVRSPGAGRCPRAQLYSQGSGTEGQLFAPFCFNPLIVGLPGHICDKIPATHIWPVSRFCVLRTYQQALQVDVQHL